MDRQRILVVEDESVVAMDLESRLMAMGYEVVGWAMSGEKALELAESKAPDLVMMDIMLQGEMDGIAAAEQIRSRFHRPVIFLTAYSEESTLARAKLAEPFGYILKPFEDRELRSSIEIALYKHHAEEEIRRLNRLYDVLSQVNQMVVRADSREALLTDACRLVVERGSVDVAWIGWLDERTRQVVPAARFGPCEELLAQAKYYADERSDGGGNPGLAVKTGLPSLCNQCRGLECPHLLGQTPAQLGFQSCGSFPISFQGEVVGALSVCVTEKDFFGEREVSLLREVAGDISFALDKIESDLQRRRLQEDLSRHSRFLQSLIEAMPYPVFYKDSELRYLGCNRAYERFTDLGHDHITGKTAHELWPADIALEFERADRELLAGLSEGIQIYETSMPAPGGEMREVLFHKSLFRDAQGQVGGIIGALEDVTQRKRAEEILRQSERRFRQVVEAAPEGIFIQTERRFAYLNPAAVKTLGAGDEAELLGQPVLDWVHPQDRESSLRRIRMLNEQSREAPLAEVRFLRKDGGEVEVEIVGVPFEYQGRNGALVFIRDIGQRKAMERDKAKLENDLIQAQKMEALGTLAGGIAHDFNNILGAIAGYAEMAKDMSREGQDNTGELTQVMAAAERAGKLVRQILTFSRKAEAARRPMNLNKAVEQTLKMLESALPKMVAIETRLAADLCTIDADPTQMEQMVMNLATNAADAMAEGGRLIMETGRETILAEQCLTCGKTFSGEFALLRVSDNGLGIAEADLQRIFEPFFTTKGLGQGTGLGLATVYGVVKGHGGHIQCQSRVGEGTTFTVYLPCQQIASQGPATRDTAADKPAGGNETVLLVDDEEPLRALGQRTLKGAGYRVLTAPSGEKALELYKEAGSGIDLVVLDLSMPGMGGLKCLKEMMAINPALRVVIASGYAEEGQVGQSLEAGAAGFVAKPFSRAQLLNAVREALDRRA